jgi:hypothetical protein
MSTPRLPEPLMSPSEAAAAGVLDTLPPDHWERWNAQTTARIRAKAQHPRCCCGPYVEISGSDTRCSRCQGFPR